MGDTWGSHEDYECSDERLHPTSPCDGPIVRTVVHQTPKAGSCATLVAGADKVGPNVKQLTLGLINLLTGEFAPAAHRIGSRRARR